MKIVAYYRVSTKKQQISGLGLDAQKAAVADFGVRNNGKIIAEYTETEKGKRTDRPKLQEAIACARLNKATLVVAKLDRLARNVEFTAALMNSGVEFTAVDNPHANNFSIHILAAVAEHEAVAISRRTKDALAAAKAKGTLLGSARPDHWKGREHKRGFKKGAKASAKVRLERALTAYEFLLPTMQKMVEEAKPIRAKLRTEMHEKLRAAQKRYAPLIVAAEEKLASATGHAKETARKSLANIHTELETENKAIREAAQYPTYDKIAEHLNSLGHQCTSGGPFNGPTVWRILKRAEKAGQLKEKASA